MCESVKSKNSREKCNLKPLKNLRFCGKHSKMSNPIIWKYQNKLIFAAILIQKIWRGYRIQNRIRLSGPGVLNRKICHNDEEIYTFEDKYKQSPLDYFAFEEQSKIWWFGLNTIIKWSFESPLNPYTKQPLSLDTRRRLRELYDLNFYDEKIKLNNDVHSKCIILSQIMQENGFDDINYTRFQYISRLSLVKFTQSIINNLEIKLKDPKHIFINLLTKCLKNQFYYIENDEFIFFQYTSILIYILRSTKKKFDICFIIMSALYTL
jgi:hypothetical protein